MASVESQLSRQVGLIPQLTLASGDGFFADGTNIASASTGDIRELMPAARLRLPNDNDGAAGSGCGTCASSARHKALMETLERYAAIMVSEDEIMTASRRSLGDQAMPGLQFYTADGSSAAKRAAAAIPIRWVQGYVLNQRRTVYVPLALAHLHVEPGPGEDIFPQSTAGLSAWDSLEGAVLRGLYEVIERDAVEAVWRLRLALSPIELDGPLGAELTSLSRHDELQCIDQRYYDATSDLGVPTVYAIRRLFRPVAEDVIVSCATHHDIQIALLKARLDAGGQQVMRLREAGGPYSRFPSGVGPLVADWQETPPDFGFLNDGASMKPLSSNPPSSRTDAEWLADATGRLSAQGRDIIVVNLTTSELRELGHVVVRVILPSLIAAIPGDRSRRPPHRRLREVARHHGLGASAASEVNHNPQPFC